MSIRSSGAGSSPDVDRGASLGFCADFRYPPAPWRRGRLLHYYGCIQCKMEPLVSILPSQHAYYNIYLDKIALRREAPRALEDLA